MRAFYKRLSVISGFGLLIAVLLADAVIIHRQLDKQVESHVWVAHTKAVLLQIQTVESLLMSAETGQRGYLLTGEPAYLAPYDLAVGQVDNQVQKLADLTADNPRQLARIPLLRSLAQQKLNELGETLALQRSGHADAARALVLTNRGLHTMDSLRTLLGEMKREETFLDGQRTATYQRSVRFTSVCIYLATLLAAAGLILLAHFVLRDIKTRERHTDEIRQREEWFRVTLTSVGDGVIATDELGNVIFINPIAERLTGNHLAKAKGRPIAEVFPIYNELTLAPIENPVRKVMSLGNIVGLANHTVLRHTNGTLIPIEDSAAPIRDDRGRLTGVVLVFRDATAERQSQELIRKTEKIAAAARLAATVAHEINNPLEAVGNLIYLARLRPGVPEAAIGDLNAAEEELARVSHVTRQTLGFHRESTFPDTVDMPALVDSVLRLYTNKLNSKNIAVQRSFSDCPALQGWAGELRQVVSNLVSNAIDAMNVEGTLKVCLACAENGNPIPHIDLSIEDDGKGIAPEHLKHIFEPFFTTKMDVGTGLGLYVSKQIVERHGGRIQVSSSSANGSRGTVFSVLLPCLERAQMQTATVA